MDSSLRTQLAALPYPFSATLLYAQIPDTGLRQFVAQAAVATIPRVVRQRLISQEETIALFQELIGNRIPVAERVIAYTRHGIVPIVPRNSEDDPIWRDPEQHLAVGAAIFEPVSKTSKPFILPERVPDFKRAIGDSFLMYHVRDLRFPPEMWEKRPTFREAQMMLEQQQSRRERW